MQENNNLAYDYSIFGNQVRSQVEIKQVKPSTKANAFSTVSIMRAISYMLAVIGLLSLLIYGKASQAQLEAELASTTKQISLVADQNARLKIRLESELSLQNIEAYAKTELGLDNLDGQQVEYVNFNSKDTASVIKKKTIWESLASYVSEMLL